MAQGISTHWTKDGPTSRVAQASFRSAQERAACAHPGEREFCPQHFYRGCPAAS